MRPIAAALAALAAPAAAQPAPPAAPTPAWVTELFIARLEDDLAANPATARFAVHRTQPFANWRVAPAGAMPADLAARAFAGESLLLVDIDPAGHAAGCRPLRAAAVPRLDRIACALIAQPDYFSIYLLPPRAPPPARRWVVGVSFETLTWAAAAARRRGNMRPFLAAPPPPPAPRPAIPPPPPAPPSQGPRRALGGMILADQYADLPDRALANGAFLAELAVDAGGMPTACAVARSTGNPAVDRRTCDLLMQTRYSLRADAAGTLIADTVTQPVDLGWVLGPPPRAR